MLRCRCAIEDRRNDSPSGMNAALGVLTAMRGYTGYRGSSYEDLYQHYVTCDVETPPNKRRTKRSKAKICKDGANGALSIDERLRNSTGVQLVGTADESAVGGDADTYEDVRVQPGMKVFSEEDANYEIYGEAKDWQGSEGSSVYSKELKEEVYEEIDFIADNGGKEQIYSKVAPVARPPPHLVVQGEFGNFLRSAKSRLSDQLNALQALRGAPTIKMLDESFARTCGWTLGNHREDFVMTPREAAEPFDFANEWIESSREELRFAVAEVVGKSANLGMCEMFIIPLLLKNGEWECKVYSKIAKRIPDAATPLEIGLIAMTRRPYQPGFYAFAYLGDDTNDLLTDAPRRTHFQLTAQEVFASK